MLRIMISTALILLFLIYIPSTLVAQDPKETEEKRTLSLDVKDLDIRDVIRMISKGYGLNIILDNDVNGKVTLHLTDAPIIEGLKTLAESNGWELTKEGSVYRIHKATPEQKSSIRYSRGKLTVDIQNVDVLEFIKEISAKSAVSIVPDSKLTGKVSGTLFQEDFEDGLKAILEINGFQVTKRKNIFRVSQGEREQSGSRRTSSRRSRRSGKAGKPDVEVSDGLLRVDVINGNLEDVITAISEQSETNIIIYGRLSGEVNARLENVPLTEGLALLLGGTKFTFVQKDSVILIGDRNTATPSGKTLSKSELIHLKHIKADEVPKILPKNIPANNIKVIKEQNALLISGTSEDIVKTSEFLSTIDIPTPQVIIEALVVEYNRDVDKDFGFRFSGGSKTDNEFSGSNFFSFPSLEYHRKGEKAKQLLKDLSFPPSIIERLPTNFYMSLRLLEEQQKAKVLAHPSITVLNGNKAKIDVGQTQYFKILGGTEQNPTENFRPINFGIRLNITPWISKSGQITAEINPEISNSIGINEQGYPDVSRRSITTTVRIDDGKTLILGGLLKTDEQITHAKVPILGDLPILGYLFKTTKKIRNQTNLVIYITPKVIKKNQYVDLNEEIRKFDINEKKGIFNKRYSDNLDIEGLILDKNEPDTSPHEAAPQTTEDTIVIPKPEPRKPLETKIEASENDSVKVIEKPRKKTPRKPRRRRIRQKTLPEPENQEIIEDQELPEPEENIE